MLGFIIATLKLKERVQWDFNPEGHTNNNWLIFLLKDI